MRFPLVLACFMGLLAGPVLMGQSGAAHGARVGAKRAGAKVAPTGPVVVIDTTMGRVVCRLYAVQAPEMTANFVGLAQGTLDWPDAVSGEVQHGKPFYDGTALLGIVDGVSSGRKIGGTGSLAVKKASGFQYQAESEDGGASGMRATSAWTESASSSSGGTKRVKLA